MSVLFIALPVAFLLGGAAVVAFILSARSGQFDDLDTPPRRMLFDEIEPLARVAAAAPAEASRKRWEPVEKV